MGELVYKKKGFLYELKKNKVLFLMLVPAILFFIIFCYLPMLGVYMAFSNYNFNKGVLGSDFVGLDNFRFLVLSGRLFEVTRNTVLYNLVFIALGMTTQIMAAIFISEIKNKFFKKISQSAMFLPYFISMVLVSVFVYQLFGYEFGSLNSLLKSLGLEPVDVFNYIPIWKYILVFFYIWKSIGYGMVLYLAVITGISDEYYEAATIDGANILQQIRHITLPLLKPTIIMILLFNISGILVGQFELFYQVIGSNGLLYPTTDVIDTFVFRSLLQQPDYGLTAAAGFYQSLFGFILIMTVNFVVKKVNNEYALF